MSDLFDRPSFPQIVYEEALRLWREREETFPAFVRRIKPDKLDVISGAWAAIVDQAEANVRQQPR